MYDRIVFGGREYKSYASVSEHAYEHTITFNAGSKTYSMTGWRIGYAAGPADLIKAMSNLQSQTTSGTATFVQHALAAALSGDQSAVTTMRGAFEERGAHICRRLNSIPGVVCPEPSGAFYVFPDVSQCYDKLGVSGSIEFSSRLLEEAHVAVVPGEASGHGTAAFRLSFCDQHGKHRPWSRQDRRFPEVSERGREFGHGESIRLTGGDTSWPENENEGGAP